MLKRMLVFVTGTCHRRLAYCGRDHVRNSHFPSTTTFVQLRQLSIHTYDAPNIIWTSSEWHLKKK